MPTGSWTASRRGGRSRPGCSGSLTTGRWIFCDEKAFWRKQRRKLRLPTGLLLWIRRARRWVGRSSISSGRFHRKSVRRCYSRMSSTIRWKRSPIWSVPPPGNAPANTSYLLHLYVERFNQRDWDGLRELISADARLLVADRFDGDLIDSPYFSNYERSKTLWRVAAGEVDGEPAIIMLRREGDGWTPRSAVRLHVTGDRITRIVDYGHCPWVLRMAKDVTVG